MKNNTLYIKKILLYNYNIYGDIHILYKTTNKVSVDVHGGNTTEWIYLNGELIPVSDTMIQGSFDMENDSAEFKMEVLVYLSEGLGPLSIISIVCTSLSMFFLMWTTGVYCKYQQLHTKTTINIFNLALAILLAQASFQVSHFCANQLIHSSCNTNNYK